MAEEKKNNEKKIGDEAVKRATGKEWKEWFELIDKAGGKKMESPANCSSSCSAIWYRSLVAADGYSTI